MSKIETSRTYEVTFNNPEFNATYTFYRHESGAFAYGNGSAVSVYRNGKRHDLYDTRYDKEVMKDFTAWCENWLKNAFNPDYEPKWEEMKGQPFFN